jgi:hypothetical protein
VSVSTVLYPKFLQMAKLLYFKPESAQIWTV